MPSPPSRSRRAVRVIAVGAVVVLAATGCVGRLGRNDDDVQPDSDHPSANNAILVELPRDSLAPSVEHPGR